MEEVIGHILEASVVVSMIVLAYVVVRIKKDRDNGIEADVWHPDYMWLMEENERNMRNEVPFEAPEGKRECARFDAEGCFCERGE